MSRRGKGQWHSVLAVMVAVAVGLGIWAKSSQSFGFTSPIPIEEGFKSLMGTAQPGPAPGWDEHVVVNEEGFLEGDGRYRKEQFGDFVLRFDFRSKPAANSGIGIRAASSGNAAFDGMEIQVLDDAHPDYANIHVWQHHGSIYGVVPAKTGSLKPAGEWNTEEIRAEGDHIVVTVNGKVVVDAKLNEAAPGGKTLDGKEHPGLFNESGYLALCGHGGGVEFRNMRIKPLAPQSPKGEKAEPPKTP